MWIAGLVLKFRIIYITSKRIDLIDEASFFKYNIKYLIYTSGDGFITFIIPGGSIFKVYGILNSVIGP